jgi:hypothetical protein
VSRSTRRIDYGQFPGGEGFELDDKAQEKVAEACGYAISDEIWEEIFEATSRYTIPESAIRNAPALEEIEGPLNSFLQATEELHGTITKGTARQLDPFDIRAILENLPPPTRGNIFDCYVFLLDWLMSYTRRIQELRKDGYYIGFKGTGLWDDWIIDIARIMQRNGFRTGRSKNTSTPFVKFIRALQENMPEECRRHQQSDRSLAEAISRALPSRAK